MNQVTPSRGPSRGNMPLRVPHALDLRALVGVELPPGRWRSVTQDDVDRFVALTGDSNWIHSDTDRAASELDTASTIVPGQLLLALVPALFQEVCVVSGSWQSRVASLRKVRFRRVVRPGDRFRLCACLTLVEPRRGFVQVDTACDLELICGQKALMSRRTDVFFDLNVSPT